MPVKKIYELDEVQSAIDMANHHYYRQFLRVRSDVSTSQWAKSSVKVARDSSGATQDPMAWQGRGSDVGHGFRHVQGTAEPGKSTYEDDVQMVAATREALNSTVGQQKLGLLDTDNPNGDEYGNGANRKIQANLTGVYYGFPTGSTTKKQIKTVVVEVMKVGESTLWIHSTYPKSFIT